MTVEPIASERNEEVAAADRSGIRADLSDPTLSR
jgi:hypothetical protein